MIKKIVFTGLIILSLVLMIATSMQAQGKYFTRTGYVSFYSSTPVEDITAVNEKASCVLDTESGQIEMAVLMKAFVFKKALMEEHFNENYVESAEYPKATFSGSIINMKEIDFSKEGIQLVTVKGNLTMHGVTKEIITGGSIEIKDGNMYVNSEFKVSPEDYDIEIPSVVREKIANEILVTIKAKLAPL
jgi:hypothetical protein